MTEAEWLASDDPAAMLRWLTAPVPSGGHRVAPHRYPSERKSRLFVAAGLRVVLPESRLVPQVEEIADAESPSFDRRWWATDRDAADAARCVTTASVLPDSNQRLAALLRSIVGNPFATPLALWDRAKVGGEVLVESEPTYHLRKRRPGERPANAEIIALLPDGEVRVRPAYGGNPGIWKAPKPIPCPWLTPTVLDLARTAYDERPGRRCEACEGSRVVRVPPPPPWHYPTVKDCFACHGEGRIEDGLLDPVRAWRLGFGLHPGEIVRGSQRMTKEQLASREPYCLRLGGEEYEWLWFGSRSERLAERFPENLTADVWKRVALPAESYDEVEWKFARTRAEALAALADAVMGGE